MRCTALLGTISGTHEHARDSTMEKGEKKKLLVLRLLFTNKQAAQERQAEEERQLMMVSNSIWTMDMKMVTNQSVMAHLKEFIRRAVARGIPVGLPKGKT